MKQMMTKKKIITRIEKTRHVFANTKKLLCSKDVSLPLKLPVVKCYVYSTLLSGMETQALKQRVINQIEAMEMWICRRIVETHGLIRFLIKNY